MSSYSPKQWRAINHYLKKNNLKAELSAYPFLRMRNSDGDIKEVHISSVEVFYEGWLAQEKRRKAEERKELARAKKMEHK